MNIGRNDLFGGLVGDEMGPRKVIDIKLQD